MTIGGKVRLVLYVTIAALSTFVSGLSELTTEIVDAMFWPQWLTLILTPVLSALVVARAYADQTLSRDGIIKETKEKDD